MPSPDFSLIHVVYALDPASFTGGVSKMVYELACAQRAQGMDVAIWTVAPHASMITNGGVEIRSFAGKTRLGVTASADLNAALKTRACNLGGRLVVHAHNTFHPLNRHVRQALHGTQAQLFYSAHGALDPVMMQGTGFKSLKKRAYISMVERANLNAATGVFALTSHERGQLDAIGLDAPVHVIPNGIAQTDHPVRARQARAGYALGFIGRINPKKGLHHLLEALHLLRWSHPGATLTIAGNRDQFPAYVAKLDTLADRLDLNGALHWPGFLDAQGKHDMLVATDVFVHASDSEGMPMAVLEAMEAGVACVVTPGCYMQKAADAGAVLEVAQDPAALAQALVKLASAPSDRDILARSGQYHARTVHAWPQIADSYRAIYTKADRGFGK